MQGVVSKARKNLQHHKLAFAHDVQPHADLLSAVHAIKPTALIGVSTVAGAFTSDVLCAMAQHNPRPIVFPLSNPTHLAECTYEQAMDTTGGRVLFASGSPFQPVTRGTVTYHPAQANNAYVFPAIGHAAVIAQAKSIPDDIFLVAASVLANVTTEEQLNEGWLFPRFDNILDASQSVMLACCEHFERLGLGHKPAGALNWQQAISSALWMNPILEALPALQVVRSKL